MRGRRHRALLDYARRSLFDSSPGVAFYAGVAAANCGELDAEQERNEPRDVKKFFAQQCPLTAEYF